MIDKAVNNFLKEEETSVGRIKLNQLAFREMRKKGLKGDEEIQNEGQED
jgi:hypothetical protein